MSNEAVMITLLSIIGFLLVAIVAFYIKSVEDKFASISHRIDNLCAVIGMRKSLRLHPEKGLTQ